MNTKSKPHSIQAVFLYATSIIFAAAPGGLLVSALASRSGGATIIAASSLVMGPLGPLVGAIWLRRTRKPWFWINLDRETQITPARPTDDAYVREPFTKLENGDGAAFFDHVDDKVDWTVEGTHPLAGHYRSKADFIAGTFAKLNKVLPRGAQLVVSISWSRTTGRSWNCARSRLPGTDFVSTIIIAGSFISTEPPSTASAPISTRPWSPGSLRKIRSADAPWEGAAAFLRRRLCNERPHRARARSAHPFVMGRRLTGIASSASSFSAVRSASSGV
jgi:hypothetical protein